MINSIHNLYLPSLQSEGTLWENRREEIKELLQREEYGFFPEKYFPHIKLEEQRRGEFSGNTVWESYSFTFEGNGKKHTVPVQLLYPGNKTNIPFVIFINFRADIPDKYLYVEDIIEEGIGVATFCYKDVSDDSDLWDGIAPIVCPEAERNDESCGKIVLWSYMAQRVMDFLYDYDIADKNNIAVMGHSRLGKCAMLTAAFDERIRFACINDSGCCGAAISRGKGGEDIAKIVTRFPFWFCNNLKKYAGNEAAMPFDQHYLAALIAPRLMCVGTAMLDTWADTDYQYLCCRATDEIYKEIYNLTGLESETQLPVKEGYSDLGGSIGFYCRSGTHFMSVRDWRMYIKFIKNNIKRRDAK